MSFTLKISILHRIYQGIILEQWLVTEQPLRLKLRFNTKPISKQIALRNQGKSQIHSSKRSSLGDPREKTSIEHLLESKILKGIFVNILSRRWSEGVRIKFNVNILFNYKLKIRFGFFFTNKIYINSVVCKYFQRRSNYIKFKISFVEIVRTLRKIKFGNNEI